MHSGILLNTIMSLSPSLFILSFLAIMLSVCVSVVALGLSDAGIEVKEERGYVQGKRKEAGVS